METGIKPVEQGSEAVDLPVFKRSLDPLYRAKGNEIRVRGRDENLVDRLLRTACLFWLTRRCRPDPGTQNYQQQNHRRDTRPNRDGEPVHTCRPPWVAAYLNDYLIDTNLEMESRIPDFPTLEGILTRTDKSEELR